MKLLIDANILLDVLQKREPHFGASALIWKLCETSQAQGCVSGLSIANLVYVMRRELTAGQVRDVLEKLALIFDVVDLTAADIERAAQAMWSDFEDALQSTAADRIAADYIITRNVRDFKKSRVPAITPSEYISKLKG